jgi:hypothetical protein
MRWVGCLVVLAWVGGTGIDPVYATPDRSANLALHQRVAAGSEAEDQPAAFAVDGDDHTYWASKGAGAQSRFVVHLQEESTIDRVVIPRFSGFDSLAVQVWDGASWTDVFAGNAEGQVLFGFDPVEAGKVRLLPVGDGEVRLYEVQVFAAEAQPVFVNQSGYNLDWSKRFTAPRAEDGAVFHVTREGDTEKLYQGTLSGQVGDFTDFRPEGMGPYVITVEGEAGTGTSVPFNVGPYWMERVSYRPAIDFMIDSRCWWGDAREYAPTDGHPGCPRGIGWRDGMQYSFEVPTLIEMFLSNPSAFSIDRMPIQGPYLGLREELPKDTPEIVRLIYWGVDLYLRGEVDHAMIKEQLAYFVFAYPYLSEYIPQNVYEEARDYVVERWGDSDFERWPDEVFNFGPFWIVEHTADLFQTYTQVGTGKGQFPPGHSVIPNLMMYEVALREGRADAEQYFEAAYDQTAWIIEHLDWEDPRTTKGQRMSEHITVKGLAYFLETYPDRAPEGLQEKINRWAEVAISRSDNMWDFRRYSERRWVIPNIRPPDHPSHATDTGFNEPGNVAGFPAPALAAAQVVDDKMVKHRLRQLAMAHLDNVFGRNPTGRHFSYDAVHDFEGVELGWLKEWQGGIGQLQSARGVLDGSPKETTYPYDPYAGDPGHTEGWVTFNTAWNAALAYLSAADVEVTAWNPGFQVQQTSIKVGDTIGIQLAAPLNVDYNQVETGIVQLKVNGEPRRDLQVTETSPNGQFFRATVAVRSRGAVEGEEPMIQVQAGDTIAVSYGYNIFRKLVQIEVVE